MFTQEEIKIISNLVSVEIDDTKELLEGLTTEDFDYKSLHNYLEQLQVIANKTL